MIGNLQSVLSIFTRNQPFAYLDPGTGSLIIQLLIGGLAALGISIKVFWKQIKGLFNKNKTNKEDNKNGE